MIAQVYLSGMAICIALLAGWSKWRLWEWRRDKGLP